MTVRYSKAFAKTASPMMDTFKSVITNPNFVIPTAAPLAAMAIGAGANKIRDVVSDAIEARNKAEAYKAMIAAHPVLKAKPERDVRAIYNSVYNINPGMAKDPLVAGALLDRIYSRQASYGGHEGTSNQGLLETVQELSKIRSDLAGAASNEHKIQNRFDFGRPAEALADNMVAGYKGVMDEMGEAGRLRKQMQTAKETMHADHMSKSVEAFRKAHGAAPTAENLSRVEMLATLASDPRYQSGKNRAVALASALRGRNYTPGARTGVAKYTHEWLSGKNSPPAGVPSGLERFQRQEAKRKNKS